MAVLYYLRLLVVLLGCLALAISAQRPNLVFILTDDQDLTLDSMQALPNVVKALGQGGATFNNMFVSTPVCCPSRSSILTGQYIHNTKTTKNGVANGCAGPLWVNGAEKETAAVHLHKAGYRTMFAGKYLNGYGTDKYGTAHVPPGWDEWVGLVGNSKYYNYKISDNGKAVHHGHDYCKDYFTDLIANRSVHFIERSVKQNPSQPLLLWLATPAAHTPQTPAPQHANAFAEAPLPRTPDWGSYDSNKHWLLRAQKHPFPQVTIDYMTAGYQHRLETLLSVDDMFVRVVATLKAAGRLNNTYFIFSSDNGYHLGQHSQPWYLYLFRVFIQPFRAY